MREPDARLAAFSAGLSGYYLHSSDPPTRMTFIEDGVRLACKDGNLNHLHGASMPHRMKWCVFWNAARM